MSKKNPSLVSSCVDELFKFFFNVDELRLTNDVDPAIVQIIDKYCLKEYKIVYEMVGRSCPVCGEELSKNGSVKFNLNKSYIIYKQQYILFK